MTPDDRRHDFAALDWQSPLPAMRTKAVDHDGRRFRIVEFEAGFREPDWCRRAHFGFVAAGRMAIDFAEGTAEYAADDAIDIPAGEAHRHMARPLGGPVRLFLVDPV